MLIKVILTEAFHQTPIVHGSKTTLGTTNLSVPTKGAYNLSHLRQKRSMDLKSFVTIESIKWRNKRGTGSRHLHSGVAISGDTRISGSAGLLCSLFVPLQLPLAILRGAASALILLAPGWEGRRCSRNNLRAVVWRAQHHPPKTTGAWPCCSPTRCGRPGKRRPPSRAQLLN
jgi:hypothetical protein